MVFEVTGKDLSRKKTGQHSLPSGLLSVWYGRPSFSSGRWGFLLSSTAPRPMPSIRDRTLRIGYYGAIPNKQFEYDHRNDEAVYLDENLAARKLRCQQEAFEKI